MQIACQKAGRVAIRGVGKGGDLWSVALGSGHGTAAACYAAALLQRGRLTGVEGGELQGRGYRQAALEGICTPYGANYMRPGRSSGFGAEVKGGQQVGAEQGAPKDVAANHHCQPLLRRRICTKA